MKAWGDLPATSAAEAIHRSSSSDSLRIVVGMDGSQCGVTLKYRRCRDRSSPWHTAIVGTLIAILTNTHRLRRAAHPLTMTAPYTRSPSPMLSYRHGFHAGNHADVLKAKPFWAIDTHAGAGQYALDSGYAARLTEYATGIGCLWSRKDLPAPLAEYVALVRGLNPDGKLRVYPGSPWLALHGMREQDRLCLFELHGSDYRLLRNNFSDAGRRVSVSATDGFAGLKALLPPAPRRGLILIDPSYEMREDYQQVLHALRDNLPRFTSGVYALWYPQLGRIESKQLPEKLKRLAGKNWLHVALTIRTPATDGIGMHGSGMFIVNPPWTLHDTLKAVMPYLVATLGQDAGAGFILEQKAD
jgi:23S rRNA (adenine2030-N6)-methyltransferase